MIRYLYTSQYTAPKPDDKLAALLFHTSVYTMGEVYALSGLKKAAFRQSAKDKVPGHGRPSHLQINARLRPRLEGCGRAGCEQAPQGAAC